MEDSKPAPRFKDDGCSFVVEVQPDYDREEAEGNKGSSDDMTAGVTDQQALVHREEIPDDRSSGNRHRAMRLLEIASEPLYLSVVVVPWAFRRFRECATVREHQHGSLAIRSLDIQSRFRQSELPLRQSG
jgi:hypothetical protein